MNQLDPITLQPGILGYAPLSTFSHCVVTKCPIDLIIIYPDGTQTPTVTPGTRFKPPSKYGTNLTSGQLGFFSAQGGLVVITLMNEGEFFIPLANTLSPLSLLTTLVNDVHGSAHIGLNAAGTYPDQAVFPNVPWVKIDIRGYAWAGTMGLQAYFAPSTPRLIVPNIKLYDANFNLLPTTTFLLPNDTATISGDGVYYLETVGVGDLFFGVGAAPQVGPTGTIRIFSNPYAQWPVR